MSLNLVIVPISCAAVKEAKGKFLDFLFTLRASSNSSQIRILVLWTFHAGLAAGAHEKIPEVMVCHGGQPR